MERERTGCFTLIVFFSDVVKRSSSSAVCECGIPWPYSLSVFICNVDIINIRLSSNKKKFYNMYI